MKMQLRGHSNNGDIAALIISEVHNASNADEVQRLLILESLTRPQALGDYQLKVDLPGDCWENWAKAGNNTPPYLACIPTVKRFDLLPGDLLVLSSDGLPDSLHWIDGANRWKTIMNVAHGKDDSRLGHGIVRPTGEHKSDWSAGDPPAEPPYARREGPLRGASARRGARCAEQYISPSGIQSASLIGRAANKRRQHLPAAKRALSDVMSGTSAQSVRVGLVAESHSHWSRHPSEHNVNEAELIIRNALFGDDGDKMAKEFGSDRDDISVVVVRIEELV
ncbi:hypothetical protein C8F01DRAFT_1244140 [Mycena amicta]|nr:hypothetical protein C8F01DRAFT_1244140 [Mycena amicta]